MTYKEAIEYMNSLQNKCENGYEAEAINLVIKALKGQRPQGEWLPNYTSQFRNPGRQCSLCGKVVEFSENFCPECGAYMVKGGVTDGET